MNSLKNIVLHIWNIAPSGIKSIVIKRIMFCKNPSLEIDGKIFVELGEIINKNIQIGKHTYIGHDSELRSNHKGKIKIGKYCSIASNFYAITYNHSINYITGHLSQGSNRVIIDKKNKAREINIGNDVWIGAGVTILPGVKIGNGAVIGAGSIVTKDISAYSINVGNPSRETKKRFSEEKIILLNQIEWWDWEDEKIKKYSELFNTPVSEINIEALKQILTT